MSLSCHLIFTNGSVNLEGKHQTDDKEEESMLPVLATKFEKPHSVKMEDRTYYIALEKAMECEWKYLEQPHSIVQRRLLEGNISRLCGDARDSLSRVRSPLADSKDAAEAEERSESTIDDSTEERESPEESERSLRSDDEDEEDEHGDNSDAAGKAEVKEKWMEAGRDRGDEGPEESERASNLSALQVQCKSGDADVKVSINTGCQYNHISSACCRRLGLKISPKIKPLSESMPNAETSVQIQIGSERVQCAAQVKDDEAFELCLGLQTLLELKCCVDLNGRVLRLHSDGEELPFLKTPTRSQCHHHDNNKNL